MISVQDAISTLVAHRGERPIVMCALNQALGATLSEDILAKVTLPPRNASAMDGYAVKLSDVRQSGSKLMVIGEAPAGSPFQGTLGHGEAVRIFTGGAVPDGADHIVIQENVQLHGDTLTTMTDNETARHIRKAGIDFSKGQTLITAGTLLTPAHIALAAAANHAELPIYKRPVVALIANGDELKAPGSAAKDGDIISSNAAGLGALIQSWGGIAMDMGIASDSLESITSLIQASHNADIIVPIGGASVGDYDYMRTAFKNMGLDLTFEKIAVRPGKPTWFGTLGHQRVLGLPGNPASATVCAHLFLKILMGHIDDIPTSKAVLTSPLSANGPRETYARGRVDISDTGTAQVTPFPRQDSSLMTPFAKANVLIQLPANSGPWDVGDILDVFNLGTTSFGTPKKITS